MRDGGSGRQLHSWSMHLPQGGSSAGSAMWDAKRVVFLNDVYFCAQDVIRWTAAVHADPALSQSGCCSFYISELALLSNLSQGVCAFYWLQTLARPTVG